MLYVKLSKSLIYPFLISLCFLSVSFNIQSTESYRIPPYTNYSVEDGLSQVSVYDVVQDRQGFIWLATQLGVDRFDGYDFVSFTQKTKDKIGIEGSFVSDLALNNVTGDVYIVTPQAVNIYREKDGQIDLVKMPQDYKNSGTQRVFVDSQGGLWIGSREGVFFATSDTDIPTRVSDFESTVSINDFQQDANGNMWVATSIGLYLYTKNKEWLSKGYENNEILALYMRGNELWLGTNFSGVMIADIKDTTIERSRRLRDDDSIKALTITDIEGMQDGSIWISTPSGISVYFDSESLGNNFDLVDKSGSALALNITDLYETDSGQVVFGTGAKGFGIIDRNSLLFEKVAFPKGARFLDVSRQHNDKYWVSSNVGLWHFDGQQNSQGPFNYIIETGNEQRPLDNLSANIHYSQHHQSLFVATRIGLGQLDEESNTIRIIGFSGKQIYAVESGSDGNIFVASRNHGLFYFNPETGEIIHQWDIPLVTTVLFENKELVWVTGLGGLQVVDVVSGDSHSFSYSPEIPNSMPSQVITWISRASNGAYMVGSQNRGISVMEFDSETKRASFQTILEDSELSLLSIGAIAEDVSGNFWVTTTKGISKVSSNFETVQFYDGFDGANSEGYYINAWAKSDEGRLFFAGPSNVTHFNPLNISTENVMPPIRITAIETVSSIDSDYRDTPSAVLNDSQTKELTLLPEDLMFTVSFAALEYGSPSKIAYSYRLLGFDNRWRYVQSDNRQATFTTLKPGEYVLEVRSTNRFGDWNTQSANLQVIVKPAWWQTNLFIFSAMLLTLIIIYGFFKWRTLALRMQSKLLAQKVVEKTIELQSANKQLKQLATIDPLTKLLNRRGFTEAAEKLQMSAKSKHQHIGLLVIDIDHFKAINDEYGHDVGDEVLINISEALTSQLRKNDVLARWGGEEFIVMAAARRIEEIATIAENLKSCAQHQPVKADNESITVTLTVGGVRLCDEISLEQAIKQADVLLYEGKQMGRNVVHVDLS